MILLLCVIYKIIFINNQFIVCLDTPTYNFCKAICLFQVKNFYKFIYYSLFLVYINNIFLQLNH